VSQTLRINCKKRQKNQILLTTVDKLLKTCAEAYQKLMETGDCYLSVLKTYWHHFTLRYGWLGVMDPT